MSPSISYSGRCTSRDSATSSSRGSQPTRAWIALSAGISDGPGNFPARASTPGTRTGASAIGPSGDLGSDRRRLDPHRAELELRDLAVRVDLVDRQQVRGRLSEVEGDEAVPPRLTVGHLHLKLDRAAPGADPGQLTVFEAEFRRVLRVDEHQRLWRDGVQRVRPAGHRPGVPVFEHPPGVQYERVLLVRQLLGG